MRGLKCELTHARGCNVSVAPYAGAWIEIVVCRLCTIQCFVAPYAGAWIEMYSSPVMVLKASASHPTRVRGLKSWIIQKVNLITEVAPYAGAWIEIKSTDSQTSFGNVAPYAGAWIEIPFSTLHYLILTRRTLRGCVD